MLTGKPIVYEQSLRCCAPGLVRAGAGLGLVVDVVEWLTGNILSSLPGLSHPVRVIHLYHGNPFAVTTVRTDLALKRLGVWAGSNKQRG